MKRICHAVRIFWKVTIPTFICEDWFYETSKEDGIAISLTSKIIVILRDR